MTIEEAKICLSILVEVKHRLGKDYEANALKLGIEALKRIKYLQGIALYRTDTTLPGETKD